MKSEDKIQLKNTSPLGEPLVATFLPDGGMNLASYKLGEIEVIDYIRDKLTTEEFVGYCSGNVLKYQSRWRLKGGIEDLRKASVYLDWQIEALIEIAEGAIK